MDLQYWNNGEPVITESGLGELKYWNNGAPHGVLAPVAAGQTEADAIMFGMNM